jgi:hypothetical protein
MSNPNRLALTKWSDTATFATPQLKASPEDPESKLHSEYVRVATGCVIAYLAGETTIPVESHPEALAARDKWFAAEAASGKTSSFI